MRVLWQIGLALVCANIARAESLKGVVVSDHHGQGAHASGMVQLAVGSKVHDLYYGEPISRRFRSDRCSDIGAIWSVVVRLLPDSSRDIVSATCTGQVDENVHGPWLVVRDYLRVAGGSSSQSASTLLSRRWRSSPEFHEYEAKLKDLDLSRYRTFGSSGTCINVAESEGPDRANLLADGDCYLKIDGKPVDLLFNVLRNAATGHWEIDDVKIE